MGNHPTRIPQFGRHEALKALETTRQVARNCNDDAKDIHQMIWLSIFSNIFKSCEKTNHLLLVWSHNFVDELHLVAALAFLLAVEHRWEPGQMGTDEGAGSRSRTRNERGLKSEEKRSGREIHSGAKFDF